ncbi:MAG: DUF456 domain-containing protein [Baekduia sp.]
MGEVALVVCGLVMLAGLAGVVVPVLPGLVLMVGAALWWAIADGGSLVHWSVFVVIAGLGAAGTALKYMVPARTTASAGTPTSILALAFVFAVVGFFVLPIIGAPIGFVLGVYVGEWRRLGGHDGAWAATKAALKGVVLGALIEGTAAVLIIGIWLAGVQWTGGNFGLF